MSGSFVVSMDGMDQVVMNLNKVSKGLPRQVRRVVKSAAKDCFQASQVDCPVGKDTTVTLANKIYTEHIAGSLKGSGKVTTVEDSDAGIIMEVSYGGMSDTGQEVDYAVFVELGTIHMHAQPYLYPNFLFGCRLLQIDLLGLAALSNIV